MKADDDETSYCRTFGGGLNPKAREMEGRNGKTESGQLRSLAL